MICFPKFCHKQLKQIMQQSKSFIYIQCFSFLADIRQLKGAVWINFKFIRKILLNGKNIRHVIYENVFRFRVIYDLLHRLTIEDVTICRFANA